MDTLEITSTDLKLDGPSMYPTHWPSLRLSDAGKRRANSALETVRNTGGLNKGEYTERNGHYVWCIPMSPDMFIPFDGEIE